MNSRPPTGALSGIRVIDFGRFIAGPFCAALLGDFGADVIRVEKREGSEDRGVIPLAQPGAGSSAAEGSVFLQMNRNKRCLTLDPRASGGHDVVRRLIRHADVVVANLPGQALKALGLDYETVSSINPRAILAAISAFGLEGPYATRVGFDAIAQAMSGAAYLSGSSDQPVRSAAPWVDFGTATLTALGIMVALRAREETGRGQLIEASLLRTALNYFSPTLIEESALRLGRQPSLNRSQHTAPMDLFRTRDGWIMIAVTGDPLFRRAARLIAPEWLDDPGFSTDKLRGDKAEIISKRVQSWCETQTNGEALAALEEARVPAGPVNDARGALDDPHVESSDFFSAVAFPGLGNISLANTPVKLHGTPGAIRVRAPLLGEHTEAILAELGYSAREIADLKAAGAI